MLEVGQEVEVQIEKLVYGGSGLARYKNFVVFIPYTSPQDKVLATITKVKKSFAEAKIKTIIEKGPYHIQAPCPVFGECGGCDWQNTKYEEQIQQKKEILKEILKPFYNKDITWHTAKPWHYRNRIQIKAKNAKVGFYKKGSHEIADASQCEIIERPLLEKIREIKKTGFKKPFKMEIYIDENGIVNTAKNKKAGEASGFSQVNTEINELLVNEVSSWFFKKNFKTAYDFYCGKGNFSEALKKRNKALNITAVDISETNIKEAKEKGSGIDYICADVEKWMSRNKITEPACILVDPPRTGLSKGFLQSLEAQAFTNMIYISCNPMTFKRDIEAFNNNTATPITIEDVKAFDMFPQTYHFEIAALLKRAY